MLILSEGGKKGSLVPSGQIIAIIADEAPTREANEPATLWPVKHPHSHGEDNTSVSAFAGNRETPPLARGRLVRSRAKITCTVLQPIHPVQGLASPPLARIRSLGRFAPYWRRSSSLTYQRVCALLTLSPSFSLAASLLYKLFIEIVNLVIEYKETV